MSLKTPGEYCEHAVDRLITACELIKQNKYAPAGMHMSIGLQNIDKALRLKKQNSNFSHGFDINEEFRMSLARMGYIIQAVGESLKMLDKIEGHQLNKELYLKMYNFFVKLCDYYDVACDVKPVY